MLHIRSNVFETNSSSTHALTLDASSVRPPEFWGNVTNINQDNIEIPLKYFGWKPEVLVTPSEKLSYLISFKIQKFIWEDSLSVSNINSDNIRHVIEERLPEVENAIKIFESYFERNVSFVYEEDVGIDHQGFDNNEDKIVDILKSEQEIANFLFSDESFVITGNDNDDMDIFVNDKLGRSHNLERLLSMSDQQPSV